jgi:hypothetical protein
MKSLKNCNITKLYIYGRKLMVHNYDQYNGKTTICRISPSVNSRDGIDFAMLFTLGESRRTSDPFPPSAGSRDCGRKLQLHP